MSDEHRSHDAIRVAIQVKRRGSERKLLSYLRKAVPSSGELRLDYAFESEGSAREQLAELPDLGVLVDQLGRYGHIHGDGLVSLRPARALLGALRANEDLVTWSEVYVAGPDPTGTPIAIHPTDEDDFDEAKHLMGKVGVTHGIDAWYAWRFEGGDGHLVELVDVERGWRLEHPEIDALRVKLLPGSHNLEDSKGHGLAVLAVIAGSPNDAGALGIAPNIGALYASSTRRESATSQDRYIPALRSAWKAVRESKGIVLVEAHLKKLDTDGQPLSPWLPIEVNPFVRLLIAKIVQSGVTVIATAGNGGADLAYWMPWRAGPTLPAPATGLPFLVGDSGSVLVGMVNSAWPHCRAGSSNYGSPVDAWAWGDNIHTARATAGYGPFSGGSDAGTSGAAAIVAGVATVYQSLHRANRNVDATPAEVREALRAQVPPLDTITFGQPGPSDEEVPDPRLVMPNLTRLVDQNLALPYVYIRGSTTDSGESLHVPTSLSPDIVPMADDMSDFIQSVSLPETTAGAASYLFGGEPADGATGFLAVRVSNAASATRDKPTLVALYESPLCSSPAPWLWKSVGRPQRPPRPPQQDVVLELGQVRSGGEVHGAVLRHSREPRSYAAVLGIGGVAPATPGDLTAKPRRMRWLERRMRAITTRSVVVNPELETLPLGSKRLVALPFLLTGEPVGASAARLHVRTGAPTETAHQLCLLAPISLLTSSGIVVEDVVNATIAMAVTWGVLWMTEGTLVESLTPMLQLGERAEHRCALGAVVPDSLDDAAIPGGAVQLRQVDAGGMEMGRILWLR